MLKYLLLCSICAFAQKSSFTFAEGSDTLYHKYIRDDNARYGFDAIEDDNGDYSFRLSYFGRAITVYKLDTLSFGNVTVGVYELGQFGTGPTGEVFKMTFALKPQQAKAILDLIETSKIDSLPTYKDISGWSQGFDGIIYSLQHKKGGVYTLKNYWSPHIQTVSEAKVIEQFTNEIHEIVGFKEILETFNRMVPFQTYSYGGAVSISRIMTRKEYRRHKRIQRKLEKDSTVSTVKCFD